ncbi:unnamed protein product [Urochloa humidicola]
MARTNGARNRLIAMSGPSSRIPASPVSAIDRALSVADGRVDGSSVFLPRTGTGAARDGFGMKQRQVRYLNQFFLGVRSPLLSLYL